MTNTSYQNLIMEVKINTKLLMLRYGSLEKINILWAGAPAYQNSITQGDLNDSI